MLQSNRARGRIKHLIGGGRVMPSPIARSSIRDWYHRTAAIRMGLGVVSPIILQDLLICSDVVEFATPAPPCFKSQVLLLCNSFRPAPPCGMLDARMLNRQNIMMVVCAKHSTSFS